RAGYPADLSERRRRLGGRTAERHLVPRRFRRPHGQPPALRRRRGRRTHRFGRGRLEHDGARRGGVPVECNAGDAAGEETVMEQTTYFEYYEIGAGLSSIGQTITESDFVVHAGHTGDFFPHHMDV